MHKDLVSMFERVVALLRQDERCKGGWHFGSIAHGGQDVYSDYDPVFLVADGDFEPFCDAVEQVLEKASDGVLVFWPEGFNSHSFKNFCAVVKLEGNLHQFDFFVMNASCTQDWICRLHLTGCTPQQIIFDRRGEVKALLESGLRADAPDYDVELAMGSFWLCAEMSIKYIKRRDVFKLVKLMQTLFYAHTDLLLAQYDTLDWGGWESKISHCLPQDKQQHLKLYFTRADVGEIEHALYGCMEAFITDAREVCATLKVEYPEEASREIPQYFARRMKEKD